ncbi:hypothetical protein ISF_05098 [Cordyceps fumosorosea ARSEF 2679]|uniref:Uncharacterized protein n=1 Tax=Cordyceps fumosorosea (strain ARSEF 2679) TaxID=1081104 RepID=A0A167V0D3_CORFA|nr:hypothetical protein ISF_05098 [Cordyceps fumosorosea ARSEF 2679]OAA62089.1 hypothetical protein ISF_05098 [Cordyceps fumosorosea ARSEF 2679]
MKFSVTLAVFTGFVAAGPVARRAPAKSTGRNYELSKTKRAFGDFGGSSGRGSQGGFGGAVPETDPDAFLSPFTGLGDPSTLRPVGQKRQDFPQGLLGPDFDDDEFSSSQGGFGGAVPETDPDAFLSPFTGLGDPSTLRPVGQKRQDFPQGLLGPDFNDDDFQVNDLLPFDRPQGQDPEEVLHQNGLVDPSKLPPLTDEQSARLASLGLARH